MAFSVLQAVKASGGSVSSVTTVGVTTQTSGSQFVVFVARDANVAVSSVTDNKGNTYSVKADKYNGAAATDAWTGSIGGCWVATNASPAGGAGHTFTVTLASADFPTIVVFECSGLDVTVDAGGSASVNHSTNTQPASFTSPSITTATAADVLFGFGGNSGDNNSPSQTLTAGVGGGTYTTPTNGSQTTVAGLPMMATYQVVSATSTYSVIFNNGGANEFNSWAGIVAFKQQATNTTPSSSDSATLTEAANKIGLNGPADSASQTDTTAIGTGSSDAASVAEQIKLALLNTDSAAFADQVAIAAATSSQDTATLAEQVKLALGATDSAQLGEAMALALAHQDTATLQELVSVAMAIADAASLTDSASVTQNGGNTPTSSDAATLTESASSTAAVSTSDIGALAEQAAVKLGASDVAAMTEQIGLALVAADNAALVEQLHLAVTNAASDSAALGELQNVVAAVLAAAETASLIDAARVTQNGVSSSSLKTFTLQQRSLTFTLAARSVTFTLAKP